MGLNLSWVAVPKAEGPALLERLGLQAVGEASDELASPRCCAETPKGWFIVTFADRSAALDKILSGLSSDGDVLAFEMSETVMFSRARGFRQGQLVWAVTHDPDKDLGGVAVEGEPPASLSGIEQRLRAEQREAQDDAVDLLFEVSPCLSKSLCGYRPGGPEELEWTVLEKKCRRRSTGPGREPSFRQAMRAVLPALLQPLGWQPASRPRDRLPTELLGFDRRLPGERQYLDLEFGRERGQILVAAHFSAVDERPPRPWPRVLGAVKPRPVRVPWRRRLVTPRFWLSGWERPAGPSDVDSAVDLARQEALIADAFLRSGEPHPWVRLTPLRTLAEAEALEAEWRRRSRRRR